MNEVANKETLDSTMPAICRTLLADAADTIIVMGNDFRITWCSNADQTILGRPAEAWEPGSLGELLHPDDQLWFKKKRHEILSEPGATISGKLRVLLPEGEYRTVQLTATNRFDDPEVNGLVLTASPSSSDPREISAKEDVRRAHAAKRQAALLSVLRTEIQSAISNIQTSTAAISLAGGVDMATHLDTIENASTSLHALFHDVVDLSRISTGTMELESVVFSPSHLLDDLVTTFEPGCAQRGLDLELRIHTELPTKLRGDSARLEQALRHLVSSAIDSSPAGTIQIDVSAHDETRIRFQVTDSSGGPHRSLDPGVVDVLPPGRQSSGDADVGTAIALQIVDLMDGSFGYTASDQGTAIWFDVAFGHARRIADRPTTPRPPVPAPPKAAHVLIVDDSDVNRLLAASQLERLGHTYATAVSGQTAIDILTTERFDAVLMDWHMPGMNGLEATRRWRTEHDPDHRLPIITMTASAMAGDRERCLAAGASDYLSKPVSINDLGTMLTRWTQSTTSVDERNQAVRPAEACSLDQSRVASLIADLGDLDVVRSIVQAFLAMVPQYRADAEAAFAIGDNNTVRRCAHTLKSTALMLGIEELAEACIMLEASASMEPKRNRAELDMPVTEFVRCCYRAEVTLTDLGKELAADALQKT